MKYQDIPKSIQPSELEDCMTVDELLKFIKDNNISGDTKIVSMRVSDRFFEDSEIPIVENEGTVIEKGEADQYIGINGVFEENECLFFYPF